MNPVKDNIETFRVGDITLYVNKGTRAVTAFKEGVEGEYHTASAVYEVAERIGLERDPMLTRAAFTYKLIKRLRQLK